MPKPRRGESQDDFISRCIPQLINEEGYESDQAAAICHSLWDEHKKLDDTFSGVLIKRKD